MRVPLILLATLAAVTSASSLRVSSAHAMLKRDVESDKKYLSKMTTCVRNRFGSTSTHLYKQERCVYKHMKRVLETRDRVSCKLCDRYFYCQAGAEAKSDCGHHHHVKATLETVRECPEIRSTDSEQDESLSEAAELGWSSGGCEKSYLCSAGCRFASKNETCSLTCR